MQTLFHNIQTNDSLSDKEIKNTLRNIITLHPIKKPQLMTKVYLHSKIIKLNALRNYKILLEKELKKNSQKRNALQQFSKHNFVIPQQIDLIRQITPFIHNLKHWDYFSLEKILFCSNEINCPRHIIDFNIQSAYNKIIVQVIFFFFITFY